MNEKWTRRDFLRVGAASALVGGVSLLVLAPRGEKCVNAWDCTSCSLDPKKDAGCPKYGEDVVDQDASAGKLPSAGGDTGGTSGADVLIGGACVANRSSLAGEDTGSTGEDSHA